MAQRKTNPKTKKSKSKSVIIPEIEGYLTPNFKNRNFKRSSLRSSSSIKSLISTGDLQYLRSLCTNRYIYGEEVFWDQIREWKKLAYDYMYNQDQHIDHERGNIGEILLETVTEGFKRTIFTYKTTKVGRPSEFLPYNVDFLKEYEKVERKLRNNTISNVNLNEIRDCKTNKKINREWARKRIQDIEKRRKQCLKQVLEEMKIQFTEKEINRLILKSNADISYKILSKLYNVGVRKIKEVLSIQGEYSGDYLNEDRIALFISIELSDGSIVEIDGARYEEAKKQAYKDFKDPDSYFDDLSKILNVPLDAIRTYHTDGGKLGIRKLRTPHDS